MVKSGKIENSGTPKPQLKSRSRFSGSLPIFQIIFCSASQNSFISLLRGLDA
jgi:hypothetical protein